MIFERWSSKGDKEGASQSLKTFYNCLKFVVITRIYLLNMTAIS